MPRRMRTSLLVTLAVAAGLGLAGCSTFSDRPSSNLPPCTRTSGYPCRAGDLVQLNDPATGEHWAVTPGEFDQINPRFGETPQLEVCAGPRGGEPC